MRITLRRSKVAIASALLCLAGVLSLAPWASAAAPVIGGPTYAPATGGIQQQDIRVQLGNGLNGTGAGIGIGSKFDAAGHNLLTRPFRFTYPDGTSTELQAPEVSATGTATTTAYAINDAGVVVGDSTAGGGPYQAVRWDPLATTPTKLAGLGGHAYAVDAMGNAFGYSTKSSLNDTRPVRWNAGTTAAIELPILGTSSSGVSDGQVWTVNPSGIAVGFVNKCDAAHALLGRRAVRWNEPGTTVAELGTLSGVLSSASYAATAINPSGTSVGGSVDVPVPAGGTQRRAIRWDAAGNATELAPLSVTPAGISNASVYFVNDAGTAIGNSDRYDAGGTWKGGRAVRWDPGSTTPVELGNLGTRSDGLTSSGALAIDAAGVIYGQASLFDATDAYLGDHAVYWGADRVPVDINTLIAPGSGWVLNSVKAISGTGWISGTGTFDPDGSGGQAAYVRVYALQLTVPEPSCGLLLMVGAGTLLKRRRHAAFRGAAGNRSRGPRRRR